MACVDGFFIYNAKGDPIIHRVYRDSLSLRVVSEVFRTRVLHTQAQAANSAPVCQAGDLALAHIANRDVYLVAAMRNNANVMMALQWLDALLTLLAQYFGAVKEKAIRENFVLIYELLDECCDHGVPQITQPEVLKAYIFQRGTVVREGRRFGGSSSAKRGMGAPAADVTQQVTGAVAHRNAKASYKRNEVYLDVVETMNVLLASNGAVLSSEVAGRVLMKAFLSGMPTCSLGLNMAGADVTFHSVVSQRDWEASQCVHFVPPDNGAATEFEVMRYRLSDRIETPFRIVSNIAETGRTRVSVDLSVKALFDRSLVATSVTIDVPVPPQTAQVNIKKSKGDARYDGSAGVLRWTVTKFRGLKEHRLSADVVLVSTTREKKTWSRPPVTMNFTVPMFSASPLKVTFLKVAERSNYSVEQWVRKICTSGTYHCRIK